jgi:pyrroline-5-carboxylate reductase
MKITFFGGGNMASALIGGLHNHGFPASDMRAIELGEDNRLRIEKTFGVHCVAAPGTEVLDCDVLVLAVKPQQMHEVCTSLRPYLKEQLVISIAAGLRLADLSRWLGGYQRLVRTMPNTPALIGCGVTGMFANTAVSEAERMGAERVMQSVGSTVWVSEEGHIDGITAISGSGPAYVFLFIEALQQAALELGFSSMQAHQLSIETVLGAARLASHSAEPASVLRERVTSKGGTTEAALSEMAKLGVKEGIVAGVLAAGKRAAVLGEQLGQS